jgi:N-acetylmuramoyl-L-alanine amidase
MKIGIDMGHTLPNGGSSGAVGIISESVVNRQVGKIVIDKLQKLGHTVINCTTDYADGQSEQLAGIVTKSNAQDLDIFCSIHFNAGGGRGTEVYTFKETSSCRPMAQRILDEIVELGFVNRGLKTANFYVLRNTKAPALLIECCFVDRKEDCERFDASKMADAIVLGIAQELPSNKEPEKEKEAVKVDQWKIDNINKALKNGIINSNEWDEKADENAPVWMVLTALNNAYEMLRAETDELQAQINELKKK